MLRRMKVDWSSVQFVRQFCITGRFTTDLTNGSDCVSRLFAGIAWLFERITLQVGGTDRSLCSQLKSSCATVSISVVYSAVWKPMSGMVCNIVVRWSIRKEELSSILKLVKVFISKSCFDAVVFPQASYRYEICVKSRSIQTVFECDNMSVTVAVKHWKIDVTNGFNLNELSIGHSCPDIWSSRMNIFEK